MSSLYSLIQFVLIIASLAFIIGLIRPAIVIRWGAKQTRGRVLLYYGLGIVLLTIISDVIKPEEIKEQERQERVERLQKEQEQKEREQQQKEKERQKLAEQLQKQQEQKEKERQKQLQQAQTILEKAKQQLNSARSAYTSGKFKNAIASAQQATNTLKSISHIPVPEASSLDDQAITLLADAKEALANAPAYRLSANQLAQEYENNEFAADNKYKGKIVLVSGKIRDITKTFGKPIITIGGTEFLGGLDGVRCFFTENDEPSIARLYKGQHVKIKGKVRGKTLNVRIENCTLQ